MGCGMRSRPHVLVPRLAVLAVLVAVATVGCAEQPFTEPEPQSRIIAAWDPLACGDPHRVAVELEDHLGVPISRSVPCELGGVTLDVPHWGVWRGRIYAWRSGPDIRSVLTVQVEVDSPIVHWLVDTPR
jgi:hypothetical protein